MEETSTQMQQASWGTRFLYRVVKNEGMKTDPPQIYGWRVFLLACSACFGGMLFGMDIGTIGGVLILPAFTKYVTPVLFRTCSLVFDFGGSADWEE